MKLNEVQQWARVKFGPYSHEYGLAVAQVHSMEEWLGMLLRYVERHGEVLDLGLPPDYMKRLRRNPQERIP